MANPKVTTILNFATSGTSGVKSATSSMKNGVESASSAVDKLNSKLKSIQNAVAIHATIQAVSAVKSVVGSVVDTLGGFVNSVYGMADSHAKMADNIGKTAQTLGMEVLNFQALRSAGQHAGMSIEQVDTAMTKFSVTMSKAAAGEKSQLDLFNALGVKTKDSSGNLREMTDVMMDVADAYSKITSEADKNRISTELFGRSAQRMSLLLSGGREGVEAAIAEFVKTGAGYTQKDIDLAQAFNDSFQSTGEFISGIKKDLQFALVPAFTKLSDGVASFLDKNRPQIDSIIAKLSNKLPSIVDDITSALPTILSYVVRVADVVSSAVEFTGPWVPLLGSAAVILGGGVLTALTAIVGAVSVIGPVLVGTVIPAIGSMAAAALPVVAAVTSIVAGIAAVAYGVHTVIENWDMLISFIVEKASPVLHNFFSGIKQLANEVFSVFSGIASFIEKIPGIGRIAQGASAFWEGQKFTEVMPQYNSAPAFDGVPSGQSSAAAVAGASSSSSLTVDFRGVPRGTTITPASNFSESNFDYSAGYAFGG